MRVRRFGWLLLMVLGACRAQPVAPPHVAASKAPVMTASSPAASAAPKPNFLVQPANTNKLAGTVSVDAGYIVASGAGNIVASGGGNIVAAGAGKLITNDGGSLITNDGGSLITNDGGSLITNDGGSIVASGGGNIVASGGGNIVASGGGNIVASGGGNLLADDNITVLPAGIVASGGGNIVASGGGNRRLLAAAAASHQELPAAGLAISAFSPVQHAYVPVGVDAKGQKVYTVYSNLAGGYELYPPEEAGKLLVVAGVPGASDHRLSYNLLPAVADRLDEDTAMVTKLIRGLMFQRFWIYIIQGNDAIDTQYSDADAIFVRLTGDFIPRIRAAGRKLAGAKPEVQRAVALKMSDDLLEGGLPEGAIGVVPTLIDIMRQLRDGDATHGPEYLKSDALVALVARAHDETSLFDRRLPFDFVVDQFRKPADLADFMVRGLYGPNIAPLNQMVDQLLQDRGASPQQIKALADARQALLIAMAQRMLDPDLQAKVLAQVEAP